MRMVIDANYFSAPKLEDYLHANRGNLVVFTDFACMEAYGGHAGDRGNNAVVSIAESLKIVSHYPTQVQVLESMGAIVALQSGYPHATPNDFVDPEQTAGFAQFCRDLQWAMTTPGASRPVVEHGHAAAQYIGEAMLGDALEFPQWVDFVRANVGLDYLRRLRTDTPPTDADLKRLTECVLGRTVAGFARHPDHPRPPRRFKLLRNTVIFRFSVAHFALAEWFLARGGPLPGSEKLRNDLVDMTYVVAATY